MDNNEKVVSGFAPQKTSSDSVPQQHGEALTPITPVDETIERFLNKKFSWGALLGPIYFWANRLNKAALKEFIPGYGGYVKQLGILNGRRIVWESGVYKGDFVAFKKRQLLLDRIGSGFLILCLAIVAACIALIIFIPESRN